MRSRTAPFANANAPRERRANYPPPPLNERRANAPARAPDYARFRERFANEFANDRQ